MILRGPVRVYHPFPIGTRQCTTVGVLIEHRPGVQGSALSSIFYGLKVKLEAMHSASHSEQPIATDQKVDDQIQPNIWIYHVEHVTRFRKAARTRGFDPFALLPNDP